MAEIKKLKSERTQLRRLFTRAGNDLEQKLNADQPTREEISAGFKIFEDKTEQLFGLDERIREVWYSGEYEEEDIIAEYELMEEYRERWLTLKTRYENFLHTLNDNGANSVASAGSSKSRSKRNLRLPKLELKQFDGDVRNWIAFWGQFKKIHEDDEIEEEDKFQYLCQATVPGTSARELVESFPPSASNYQKAIEQLKSRFARDELLIEIYVHELLQLVLQKSSMLSDISLRSPFDKLETQLRALESLGVTSDKYAVMLYPLVESALPDDILKAWERSRMSQAWKNGDQSNYLETLLRFLRQEVESEERLLLARTNFLGGCVGSSQSNKEKVPTAAVIFSSEKERSDRACIWCDKGNHMSQECFKARGLTTEKKQQILKKKGACFQCLQMGHNSKRCKVVIKCLICCKGHHTIMCRSLTDVISVDSTKKGPVEKGNEPDSTENLLSHQKGQTLLQTLVVKVSVNKVDKLARVLLDTGSQRSYITKDIVHKLGLKKIGEETLTHNLFGGVKTGQEVHGIYEVTLRSLDEKFECTIPMLDQEKICGFVPRLETQQYYPVLRDHNITLSDVGYYVPEVKILLGADIIGQLLTGCRVVLDDTMIALETKLGWTLMGQRRILSNCNAVSNLFCMAAFDIADLWRLEALGISDPADVKTKEILEAETLEFFEKTVRVDQEGRYEVCLPWKEGHSQLRDSYDLAEKRLFSVSKRLETIGKLEDYDEVFREWLRDGIVDMIPSANKNDGHYLPHHPVIKESSMTTKIRPVFDASARDKRGNSLNSCLEKGPNLVELIPKLLIQFRKHAIGVIADIRKAFLAQGDKDFLRFLYWKDCHKKEVVILRHCRVVFGVSSSPFLLGATISHHLRHAPEKLNSTAERLRDSFYVDNCVTSVDNEEQLHKFVREATALMSSAQFELRGWISSPIHQEDRTTMQDGVVPVLGLLWDVTTDELLCDVKTITMTTSPVTKRNFLSVAQRVFDPIGFTCPSTLLPKLMLQETWKYKFRWDEELPDCITSKFKVWMEQVHWLARCRIPRRIVQVDWGAEDISLHIFCDASKLAYATCVFLRARKGAEVSVQLVQAKARIAPVNQVTIPRLELLAAVIGTRISTQVKEALGLQQCATFFWSDSSVALTWIKRADNWSTFVGNRCQEIRQYSNIDDWHHLPGTLNAADLPSRGCSPKVLCESKWWEGPRWLRDNLEQWPFYEVAAPEEEVNIEKRKTVISSVACCSPEFCSRLLYFSSYVKIVRMIGWIIRFFHNLTKAKRARRGELTGEEMRQAENTLLRVVQQECFRGHEQELEKKVRVFEDEKGVLRVETKLTLGEENEVFKKPILLPSNHAVVTRLIWDEHHRSQHAGLLTLLARLRDRYWILGVRKAAKRLIARCVKCKRYKASPAVTDFAPLPKDRVGSTAAFEVSGVDYAGPLYLKSGEKAWVVLFSCAVYRAIHLELVQSLTTDAFILALRRFIARRGRISVLYSDNGTNFIGCNNALKMLDWDEIITHSAVKRITWKFIPPTAAWWGGWWERLVRTVKELLRRILGRASIYYEELYTVLCDCEATINSRPLTYIEDSSAELKPLTPATFLQGIPTNETPDLDLVDKIDYVKHCRYLQKLRQDLRQRFRNEYLALLVHHGRRKSSSIKVGDVVLIGADSTKRINWPLGIVLEVYPGKDEVARVAKLKTSEGELIRPFQRLYPLEVHTTPEDWKQPETEKIASPNMKSSHEELKTSRVGRRIKVPSRLDL